MTKDDIISMAQQVEAEGFAPVLIHPEVRRLCELVAAAEREACAKVAEWTPDAIGTSQKIAAAIRARGNT